MAYGLSTRVPARSEPVQTAVERTARTWGGYQAWHKLDSDSRLNLIECALKPANDCFDTRSLAL